MSELPTPRHGHAPIAMRATSGGYEGIEKLGDFEIYEREGALQMRLAIPAGNARPYTYIDLPIYRRGTPKLTNPGWEWDGNYERPTLSPSVWTHGHWHGWVRGGLMVEA